MSNKICLFFWPLVNDYQVCEINDAQLQEIKTSKVCERVRIDCNTFGFVEIYHSLEEDTLYWIVADTAIECMSIALLYWIVLFGAMSEEEFLSKYVMENSLEDDNKNLVPHLLKEQNFFTTAVSLKALLFDRGRYEDFSLKAYFRFTTL